MHGDTKGFEDYISKIPGWQVDNLRLFRKLVLEVVPDAEEVIKWGVPVYLFNKKMLYSIGSFKAHTKYNFIANGAQLDDPKGLFNNGLESKTSRSIDLLEGETIDQTALKDLIIQAKELRK